MKKIFTLILIILGLQSTYAQTTTTTSGGEANGNGGSSSYTVGQIVYTTTTGTNANTIAQGVQQPYEISIVSGIAEANGINLKFSAYPNPTTEYLIVKVDASLSIQTLAYKLYDINGKLLRIIKATGNETQITTSHLVSATYFVKVLDNNKEIKVFKIIKN